MTWTYKPPHIRTLEERFEAARKKNPLPPLPKLKPLPAGFRMPDIGRNSRAAQVAAAQRTQLPGTYLKLEKLPVSAFDDNPVFNETGAATFLGVSPDCIKK